MKSNPVLLLILLLLTFGTFDVFGACFNRDDIGACSPTGATYACRTCNLSGQASTITKCSLRAPCRQVWELTVHCTRPACDGSFNVYNFPCTDSNCVGMTFCGECAGTETTGHLVGCSQFVVTPPGDGNCPDGCTVSCPHDPVDLSGIESGLASISVGITGLSTSISGVNVNIAGVSSKVDNVIKAVNDEGVLVRGLVLDNNALLLALGTEVGGIVPLLTTGNSHLVTINTTLGSTNTTLGKIDMSITSLLTGGTYSNEFGDTVSSPGAFSAFSDINLIRVDTGFLSRDVIKIKDFSEWSIQEFATAMYGFDTYFSPTMGVVSRGDGGIVGGITTIITHVARIDSEVAKINLNLGTANSYLDGIFSNTYITWKELEQLNKTYDEILVPLFRDRLTPSIETIEANTTDIVISAGNIDVTTTAMSETLGSFYYEFGEYVKWWQGTKYWYWHPDMMAYWSSENEKITNAIGSSGTLVKDTLNTQTGSITGKIDDLIAALGSKEFTLGSLSIGSMSFNDSGIINAINSVGSTVSDINVSLGTTIGVDLGNIDANVQKLVDHFVKDETDPDPDPDPDYVDYANPEIDPKGLIDSFIDMTKFDGLFPEFPEEIAERDGVIEMLKKKFEMFIPVNFANLESEIQMDDSSLCCVDIGNLFNLSSATGGKRSGNSNLIEAGTKLHLDPTCSKINADDKMAPVYEALANFLVYIRLLSSLVMIIFFAFKCYGLLLWTLS